MTKLLLLLFILEIKMATAAAFQPIHTLNTFGNLPLQKPQRQLQPRLHQQHHHQQQQQQQQQQNQLLHALKITRQRQSQSVTSIMSLATSSSDDDNDVTNDNNNGHPLNNNDNSTNDITIQSASMQNNVDSSSSSSSSSSSNATENNNNNNAQQNDKEEEEEEEEGNIKNKNELQNENNNVDHALVLLEIDQQLARLQRLKSSLIVDRVGKALDGLGSKQDQPKHKKENIDTTNNNGNGFDRFYDITRNLFPEQQKKQGSVSKNSLTAIVTDGGVGGGGGGDGEELAVIEKEEKEDPTTTTTTKSKENTAEKEEDYFDITRNVYPRGQSLSRSKNAEPPSNASPSSSLSDVYSASSDSNARDLTTKPMGKEEKYFDITRNVLPKGQSLSRSKNEGANKGPKLSSFESKSSSPDLVNRASSSQPPPPPATAEASASLSTAPDLVNRESTTKPMGKEEKYFDITRNVYPKGQSLSRSKNEGANRGPKSKSSSFTASSKSDTVSGKLDNISEESTKSKSESKNSTPEEEYFDITRNVYLKRQSLSTSKNAGRTKQLESNASPLASVQSTKPEANMEENHEIEGDSRNPVQSEEYFDITHNDYPKRQSLSVSKNSGASKPSKRAFQGGKGDSTKLAQNEDIFFDITQNAFPDRPSLSVYAGASLSESTGRTKKLSFSERDPFSMKAPAAEGDKNNQLGITEPSDAYYDITQNAFPGSPSLAATKKAEVASSSSSKKPSATAVPGEYFHDITRKIFSERPSLSTSKNAGATLSESPGRTKVLPTKLPMKIIPSDEYFDITQNNIPRRSSASFSQMSRRSTTAVDPSNTRIPAKSTQNDAIQQTVPNATPLKTTASGSEVKQSSDATEASTSIQESSIHDAKRTKYLYVDVTRPEFDNTVVKSSRLFRARKHDEFVDIPAFVSNTPSSFSKRKYVTLASKDGGSKGASANYVDIPSAFLSNPAASFSSMKNVLSPEKGSGSESTSKKHVDVPPAFMSNPAASFSNMKNITLSAKVSGNKESSTKHADIPPAFMSNPAASFSNMKNVTLSGKGGGNDDSLTKHADIPPAFISNPAASFSNMKSVTLSGKGGGNEDSSTKYVDTPLAFVANPASLFSNMKNFTLLAEDGGIRSAADVPRAFVSNPAATFSNMRNSSDSEASSKINEVYNKFLDKPQFGERSTPSLATSLSSNAIKGTISSSAGVKGEEADSLDKFLYTPQFGERSSLSLASLSSNTSKGRLPSSTKINEKTIPKDEQHYNIAQHAFSGRSSLSLSTPSPATLKKNIKSHNSRIAAEKASRLTAEQRLEAIKNGEIEQIDYYDITQNSFSERKSLSLAVSSSLLTPKPTKKAGKDNLMNGQDESEPFNDITKNPFGKREARSLATPGSLTFAEKKRLAKLRSVSLEGKEALFSGSATSPKEKRLAVLRSTSSESKEELSSDAVMPTGDDKPEPYNDITKSPFGKREALSLATPDSLTLAEKEKRLATTSLEGKTTLSSDVVMPTGDNEGEPYHDITKSPFEKREARSLATTDSSTLVEKAKRLASLRPLSVDKRHAQSSDRSNSHDDQISSDANSPTDTPDAVKTALAEIEEQLNRVKKLRATLAEGKEMVGLDNSKDGNSELVSDVLVGSDNLDESELYHDITKNSFGKRQALSLATPDSLTLAEKEKRLETLRPMSSDGKEETLVTKTMLSAGSDLSGDEKKAVTPNSEDGEVYDDITKNSYGKRQALSLATPDSLTLAEKEKRRT